jgi:cellulose biosynthesis protein BcsQ
MAFYMAVANRKGGVGKSTISVMLAHAFAVWGNKRVLILDLDSQCNASMILLGGEGWVAARAARKTIADYFADAFDETNRKSADYLVTGVGDVALQSGKPPLLALLPGSLLLDDVQGDLFLAYASKREAPDMGKGLRGWFEQLLRRFDADFDLVILDCAPGLSFAALAALYTADKIIVPFRPDYVSLHAVDRVALIIEQKANLDELGELPLDQRRYVCLPNYVRANPRERLLIEETGLAHPMLATELPQRDGIANSFDWFPQRRSMEEKYGAATEDVRKLYEEIGNIISRHHVTYSVRKA